METNNKELYKSIFAKLKDVKIESMFDTMNKDLFMGIATGSSQPIIGEELDKILTENNITGNTATYLKECIPNEASFRHHSIDISQYKIHIEYFVLLDRELSGKYKEYLNYDTTKADDSIPPAVVSIQLSDNIEDESIPLITATIIVSEFSNTVTDATFSKIVKHELTHILLAYITQIMRVPVFCDDTLQVPLLSPEEQAMFEEFICDYIQYESIGIISNESPITRFEDDVKNYMKPHMHETYLPFIDAVIAYYLDKDKSDNE